MDKRIFWPYDTSLVSEWPGARGQGWAYHVGTDFRVSQGTPLRATTSGTAYTIYNDGFGAYVIDIVSPDGFVVRNGHLSRIDVKNGQWVEAGDHIGLTGGRPGTDGAGLSTGPHLHWELRTNRNWSGAGWVDPRKITVYSFSELDKPAQTNKNRKNTLLMAYYANAYPKDKDGIKARWAVFGPNFWLELKTQSAANAFSAQIGAPAYVTDAGGWAKFKEVSLG